MTLPEDEKLFDSLLETMKESGADFTHSFRNLNRVPVPSSPNEELSEQDWNSLAKLFTSQCCSLQHFIKMNSPSVSLQQLQMMVQLAQQQPELLMMLGKSAEFLVHQLNLYEKFKNLKENSNPEKKTANDSALWSQWLKMYRLRLWKEVEQLDQEKRSSFSSQHLKLMNSYNPKFILRNYLAQNAIEKAEKGDYSEVYKLLEVLKSPYADKTPFDGLYDQVIFFIK